MKNGKRFFLTMFSIALIFGTLNGCATIGGDFVTARVWDGDVPKDTGYIKKYQGSAKDVIIPGEIDGWMISDIGPKAFSGRNLTSVIIPDRVSTIWEDAFINNNLTSVTIGNKVKFISNPFDNNFVAYYNGPAKQAAGTYTYDGNEWTLKAAAPTQSTTRTQVAQSTVPADPVIPPDDDFEVTQNRDGKTLTISGYKGSAKNISIPAMLYGLPVTVIGKEAFQWVYGQKGLTSVVIPEGVTTIGVSAFRANDLISVTIPNSVTIIDQQAFWENELTSVTIPNNVTTIGIRAFSENELTSVTIGNSVEIIENEAFADNKLTSVTIPNSVTSIGNAAFSNNQLTSLILGKSVTRIGKSDNSFIDGAFYKNKLTSVTIPDSVTYIGSGAFNGNPLTSLILGRGLGYIEWRAFMGSNLISITIAKDLPNINTRAGFEESFINFYTSQNRSPGTYVKNGPIWSKK